MRESVRRELWTWVQYLTIAFLADLCAAAWEDRVADALGASVGAAGVFWIPWTKHWLLWLVFFIALSLVRIGWLFFVAVKGRDREQRIGRRSW